MVGGRGNPCCVPWPGAFLDPSETKEDLSLGEGGCGARAPVGEDSSQPHLPAVIHSGDYFLFESDSEEEEETPPEDPRPSAQSAFQVRREGRLPAVPCPWGAGGGQTLSSQPAQIRSDLQSPQVTGTRRPWGAQVTGGGSVGLRPRSPDVAAERPGLEKGCACLLENGGVPRLPLGPQFAGSGPGTECQPRVQGVATCPAPTAQPHGTRFPPPRSRELAEGPQPGLVPSSPGAPRWAERDPTSREAGC